MGTGDNSSATWPWLAEGESSTEERSWARNEEVVILAEDAEARI